MHETAIAWEILDAAKRAADGAAIERVAILLGEMSGVVEDSLRFAFDALKSEAGCDAAELTIERAAVEVECAKCGNRMRPPGEFVLWCGTCGAAMHITSGEQLEVLWVETPDNGA